MYDVTNLVDEKIFNQLVVMLPTPRQKGVGRKRCTQEALLSGILQVLVNGVAWQKIAECGASGSSCWRYFRELQRRGEFKLIFEALKDGRVNIIEAAIDTTSISSFRFKHLAGWDGRHKKYATKLSLFTDKDGLPTDVLFGPGNQHDLTFTPEHVKNVSGERVLVLNCDKIYTSLDFRREMRSKGTYVNMETRRGDYTRKRGPKCGFDAEKYQVRFLVERLIGWLKGFRRLRLRREYRPAMFKGLVFLALIIILLRND